VTAEVDDRARRLDTSGGVGSMRTLPVAGGIGLLGSVCVLLGTSQSDSPFTVHAAGAWFFGHPSGLAATGSDSRFLAIMLVYVGVALLLGAWYEIVRTVRSRPGSPVGPLVVVLAAWEVPVLLCRPLFSRDVYSYAAQGQMVTKGISPYVHGPSALGRGPFLNLVDPLWWHVLSPYGPAWERLSGWIVQLSGHDVTGAVVGFRLVSLIGVTLIAWAVPVLARSVERDVSVAFALGVLNPLVLLSLLGGAHNDALMVGLLAAGCALARKGHVIGGLVLCSLAAEVKIPGLIGVVFIGWWWAGAEAGWRRRLGRLALAVGISAAVMAAIAAVSGLGWRWVSGLSNPGAVVSWLDPATGVGLLLTHGASALGYSGHQAGFADGARTVGLAVAAVIVLRMLVLSGRHGELRAIGWSLLAVVLLGPVVWPWYETWGLVFLAVVAEGWLIPLVFTLSVVACFADVPKPGLLTAGDPVLVSLCWVGFAAAISLYAFTRIIWRPVHPLRAP
jgi:alpha-1,6-mannosyltransferase